MTPPVGVHSLGDDPEEKEVHGRVVADVIEAGEVLVRPYPVVSTHHSHSPCISSRKHHSQYSTVLLSVITAALKPTTTPSAPALPPTTFLIPAGPCTARPRAK